MEGRKHSKATKIKISQKETGKILSIETKNKIGKSYVKTEKRMKQISELGKSQKGEKNYRWIKDRTKLKKSDKKHLDGQYKEWMFSVKKRDNWKCVLLNSDCRGRLEAHHIFDWINYPTLRYIINNGITLCHFHHPRGREEEKRMISIFQELLSVSKE